MWSWYPAWQMRFRSRRVSKPFCMQPCSSAMPTGSQLVHHLHLIKERYCQAGLVWRQASSGCSSAMAPLMSACCSSMPCECSVGISGTVNQVPREVRFIRISRAPQCLGEARQSTAPLSWSTRLDSCRLDRYDVFLGECCSFSIADLTPLQLAWTRGGVAVEVR